MDPPPRPLGSDHYPIRIGTDLLHHHINRPPRYNFQKANWSSFHRTLVFPTDGYPQLKHVAHSPRQSDLQQPTPSLSKVHHNTSHPIGGHQSVQRHTKHSTWHLPAIITTRETWNCGFNWNGHMQSLSTISNWPRSKAGQILIHLLSLHLLQQARYGTKSGVSAVNAPADT